MTREREVCACKHDKASHHSERHGADGNVVTIHGRCLAPWCPCTLYLADPGPSASMHSGK